MSDDSADPTRPVAQKLIEIQAAASAAFARTDTAAIAQLIGPTAARLADALEIGEPGLIGFGYQILARVHLCSGDAPSAVADSLQGEIKLVGGSQPLPVLAAHPRLDQLLELRKVRIEALVAQQDWTGLVGLAEETIQILETRRSRLHDPFLQAAFLADRTLFYEMFVFGSFKRGRWDDLLTAIDLLKARAAYLKPTAAQPAAENPEIVAKLATANATLTSAQRDSPAYRSAAEQRRLLISLRAIAQAVDEEDDPIPRLKVSQVQAVLGPGEAVVAWVWISREVLVVLAFDVASIYADRVVLSPVTRTELDAYVQALRAQDLDPATLDDTIEHLVDALWPPAVREIISRCRRLVLSPHRALHVVPFHAARSGDGWLIEHCSVRYCATVGCLLLPRQAPAARADGGLLALGIDEFHLPKEQWPSLKHAESEVAAVVAVWQSRSLPVATLTGAGATVTAWRALGSRLARFRCIHFATHGASVFDREAKNDPTAARLILEDGALDALALSQMRLAAEVVVLSACNSGQRALEGRGLEEYPGDDNFGLQAALFEAGAQRVIGALWPVVDDVAPLIMKTLHEGLAAGSPVDLALQAALAAYLSRSDARRQAFAWGQTFLSSIG